MRNLAIAVSLVRLLPHLSVLHFAPNRGTIRVDLARWQDGASGDELSGGALIWAFARTMTLAPEFRNLFYYRVRRFSVFWSFVLRPICRPMPTLLVCTDTIGPGLFIQHGFGTIITARSIGSDCWINQQVTVGFVDDTEPPIIGDRVHICVGARVLGDITLGDDVIVGANAVVVRDVPPRCVVAGVPARIIRRDGESVDAAL